MIIGDGDLYDVIAHLKCELTAAKELFVLPASGVRIGAQSREPLRHLVQVVAVFFKELKSATAAENTIVVDLVVPVDVEFKILPRF